MFEKLSGPDRLLGFSDGMFSVIITIMVLDLKVPHSAEPAALLCSSSGRRSWPMDSATCKPASIGSTTTRCSSRPRRSTTACCGSTCCCCLRCH